MNNQIKILALAGSTRRQSYNQALVKIAALGAERAGARVNSVNLADYPMPLFDEDQEQAEGLPASAEALRRLMLEHHAILLASPEYNGSLSAVLKNTLDWLSRPHSDGLSPFSNKTALLMSASPGGLGGLRGLSHARSILNNLGVLVLPQQFALPAAHEAFAIDGELKSAQQQEIVLDLGRRLAMMTTSLQLEGES